MTQQTTKMITPIKNIFNNHDPISQYTRKRKLTSNELPKYNTEDKRQKLEDQDLMDTSMAFVNSVTRKEVLDGPEKEKWKESIILEKTRLEEKGTFEGPLEIRSLGKDEKVLPIALIYAKKDDGRLKSRACVLGNLQTVSNDIEIYSPVVSAPVVKLAFAYDNHYVLGICLADISNAFVNASIPVDRRIFVQYPPEWGGGIARLRKALYGLTTSPRDWNDELNEW